METCILFANIILSMRKYQKKNNIKKQCVTNSQYLYDIIKMNSNSNSNVKTKSVIACSVNYEENTTTVVSGHIVVVLDDETTIEPSYDIFSLENVSYFENIKDFIDSFEDKNVLKTNFDIKKLLNDHIKFKKISEQINKGELIITDKEHYDKQADYIEKMYSEHFIAKKE